MLGRAAMIMLARHLSRAERPADISHLKEQNVGVNDEEHLFVCPQEDASHGARKQEGYTRMRARKAASL
jgi:hypothetical protein